MLNIQKGRETVSKTFRLPVHIIEPLERIAEDNNLSLNKLITQCLDYALANIQTENGSGNDYAVKSKNSKDDYLNLDD